MALAAASSAILLAACGSSGTSSSTTTAGASGSASSTTAGAAASNLPKTIVFSPLSLAPPALEGLAQGLTAFAGSKGWKVTVQDPNFSATTQEQDLATVIAAHSAGALWVLANDPQSMGSTLQAAQSAGIPILVNGEPSEYGFHSAQPGVTFDYIDYTAAGKALGDELGKCIVAKDGGKGDVIFAVSAPGQAGKAAFEAAAEAGLKATAPGTSIVQNIVVSARAQGQTDIGNALQGHPNVVGVMASTDEGALGALGAFAAAGKTLSCDSDFGGDNEVLSDVKSGKIYDSVALQFAADMAQSFATLVKMQSDPKATGLVLTVPQKVITAAG